MLIGALFLTACTGTLVDSEGGSGVRELGPAGGSVDLPPLGVTLTLPANAVSSAVTISLAPAATPPGGGERAVDISPTGLTLAVPATLSYSLTAATPADDELAEASGARWKALPGRMIRPTEGTLDSPIHVFGTYALLESNEICGNGVDDDGDGLVDCADPVCQGIGSCPGACTSDADCACGSVCSSSQCQAANLSYCATDAECPGAFHCVEPLGAGTPTPQACGFKVCLPKSVSGADGGGGLACINADPCTCTPCTSSAQCATGIQCVEGKKHGVSCGFNVCATAP